MAEEKIKSDAEHRYNLFSGFAIAIEIAGIIKFFDIIRLAILEGKMYYIDIVILGILFVTAIGEEIITKILFVRKREKPSLSKYQKTILITVILLYLILLVSLFFWWSPILRSAKLI